MQSAKCKMQNAKCVALSDGGSLLRQIMHTEVRENAEAAKDEGLCNANSSTLRRLNRTRAGAGQRF